MQTLNSGDRLDGGGGTDELLAVVNTSVTPASLLNIENVAITNTAAGSVIDLTNSKGIVNLTNQGSSNTTTLSGVDKAISVTVADTTFDQTVTYSATTGSADAVSMTVRNVTNATADSLTVAGIETLTLSTSGTNTLGTLSSAAAGAVTAGVGMTTAAASKIVATGSGVTNFGTLGTTVATFDASAATGAVTAQLSTTLDASVTGGSGNDVLHVGAGSGVDTVSGGAGDDTVRFAANWATTDVVTGGDGTDTLELVTAANAVVAAAPTTYKTTGFETIAVTSQLANATYVPGFISADATRFNITGRTAASGANETTAAALTTGAPTITGAAGSFTVGLGATMATNALGALAHALTINDTGTATTDSLTIVNSARVTGGAQVDVFANQNLTIGGYETVTVDTGSIAGTYMTFGTVAITGDQAASTTLNLKGANALEMGAITASTIDASGITAAGTGSTNSTAAFFMTTGNTATKITGSAGFDVLVGHATSASNVSGGAGNDSIVGGSSHDTLLGGDGDDTIDGAAGNDSIDGGANNDRVLLSTDGDLTSADVIAGGDGTDTLVFAHVATTNTASELSGVSGFEVFEFASGGTETLNLSDFVSNTTFTRVDFGQIGTGTATLNNVGASVTEMRLLVGAAGDTVVFDRLVDNSTNSLTISVRGDLTGGVTAITVADEETITISGSTSANGLLATDLTATDLKSLTITGAAQIAVANAISGANVATVDASASTGALEIHLTNNAVQATMTAGTGAAEFTGGLLADSITGGSAADTIIGGAGADTINAGAGSDLLQGGTGADVINVGAGTDVLRFGADGDTGTLTSVSGAISLTGVDVVTGMGNGDLIRLSGLGYATGAGAVDGSGFVSAFSTTTLADNAGVILRGNWAAGSTTGSGTFIGNASGADTLFIVDATQATAGQSYEAIVLVGTVVTAAAAATDGGLVTVTLTV